jgi:hypothetical protein
MLYELRMKQWFMMIPVLVWSATAFAQGWNDEEQPKKLDLGKDLHYRVEMQGSFSKGETPLWLNANKYGLSSLKKNNGYVRTSLFRPLSADTLRKWGVGYGVDVAVPVNYTSKFIVQQAYAELRWLHGTITVGSKEYPMELKNNTLSSGSQTLGVNARPVPQVRIALPDYWTLPFANRWLHLKGHIAYGKMTDDSWQHDFTGRQSKFSDDVIYHSKAGYIKIGSEERFFPLSLELGLEMACEFGGTPYYMSNGELKSRSAGHKISNYWHAFIPSGFDDTDGEYSNIEGDQLGSWVMRINWNADTWRLSLYADHFFEDHSQMFLADYDGYGSGSDWNVKKKSRFYMYKLKDMMLGAELELKYTQWLQNIVVEYLYTKYQSGPYNHDRTQNISDHVAGMDDYYNHSIYTGWQHWGQVMGNPLYRSPIYNTDGLIRVEDNRFMAFHLGAKGCLSDHLDYRLLATYQEGVGTYDNPYTHKQHNVSFMVETAYHFQYGWQVKGAYGMDFGSILGHNAGFQLTISKSGLFNL